MQALLAAIYPMLKSGFALSFGQIGLLTLIFQVTASLLQPMVGLYTDRRPQPYSLPLGMACSLIGRVTLAFALNFPALLAGSALLGIGSSIFHPESSRLGIRNAMRNAEGQRGHHQRRRAIVAHNFSRPFKRYYFGTLPCPD